MPPRRSESPNAHSKTMTTIDGSDTNGTLNQMPKESAVFSVGISDAIGPRRFMEDAHSFIIDFAGVRGQGFFAVFDGHAGKHAAEWCGHHFHEFLLDALRQYPQSSIPDVLNETFHDVDLSLSKQSEESGGKLHSGCTAVTAFLRIEDATGRQSFLESDPLARIDSPVDADVDSLGDSIASSQKKKSSGNKIKHALKSITGGSGSSLGKQSRSPSPSTPKDYSRVHNAPTNARRVLYCANAGDARGVLCRSGKAVRLTYDHKGSDKQEAKRITDAGGFMMGGRVNGVLAVTRSLGDSSMKEFVVGSPYTTETELCEDDEFVILACDGLWDVIDDQTAVDRVREIEDAQLASKNLLEYTDQKTSDNVTVLVVRFKKPVGDSS
ncbi:hypothetical protein JAAARDRAFT_35320 [Jaapia argillacea MUCL 33604]|uniref:PPM-type phosphatase domain-containing protein n=1 Tax=Jaapia argillacea MUCL 33604 TaxID=933084 RepID=A0A067PS35_9AGAM|nr:hypothetical protein JAAARDRAFT_35320 [Jaapia argillacea MUCL 33604]